jgi:hypothetical protein
VMAPGSPTLSNLGLFALAAGVGTAERDPQAQRVFRSMECNLGERAILGFWHISIKVITERKRREKRDVVLVDEGDDQKRKQEFKSGPGRGKAG